MAKDFNRSGRDEMFDNDVGVYDFSQQLFGWK